MSSFHYTGLAKYPLCQRMPYLVQEVHLIEFFIDPSSTAGHPTKADNLLIYPRRGPIEEMDHPHDT
jgi:hypothetical protein